MLAAFVIIEDGVGYGQQKLELYKANEKGNKVKKII